MTEYIVEVDDKVAEVFVERFDWETVTLFGHHLVGEIVRCRNCRHSRKDGTLCMFFASWEPIAGGDEYAEMPADVEPDGFCAWSKRRDS